MNARHLKIATELLSLPTAPFREQAVIEWTRRFVARRPQLSLKSDRWGNLLIRFKGRPAPRALVFCAHMDHPGFCAQEMELGGLLNARWIGGVPDALFPGAKVRFFSEGRWIRGTVLRIAPRVGDDPVRAVQVLVRAPVATGAVGMWDFPDPKLRGERLYARGCDDVAGTASLLCLLDDACREDTPREFFVLLTRAEEGGFFGAIGAAREGSLPRNPVLIAVETSKELPSARMGDGPIVRVGDRVAVFTPEVSDFLAAVARSLAARDKTFRFQRKLMDGGACESAVYSAYGYPAGGLCLALGNYHNVRPSGKSLGPEYIDARDFDHLIRLYRAVVTHWDRYGKTGGAFRATMEKRFRGVRQLF